MTCFTLAEEIATPMIVVAPTTNTTAPVASFGWADFPVVTSSSSSLLPPDDDDVACQFRMLLLQEPSCTTTDIASDATASTLEDLDWCDDDSILSELDKEEAV